MKIRNIKYFTFTFLLLSVLLLSSCSTGGDTRVVIAGSTSVLPYVEILEEEYRRLYPENAVGIQGGGSSAGVTAVRTGIADIGMLSRSLRENEVDLISVEIALDGLAIIIHPDNPVNNLTLQQVRDIYTHKITNWSEVGGFDAEIHIISREAGSGTRGAFQELVMGEENISRRAIVQNTNGAIRQLVSGDTYAIGFISLGLVDLPGLPPVKAPMLEGVKPSPENVLNGSYGLFREFLFVFDGEPEGYVKHFIDFILSEKGQNILREEGLVSVN
jgi:phosphate transport system substrate-binding protein